MKKCQQYFCYDPQENNSKTSAKIVVDIDFLKDLCAWFVKNNACTVFKESPILNDV